MMNPNKPYRSQTDRMLGGVCGGLAKYLHVDLTIVRLFFVILTLLGGFGPLVYLIMWIVVPLENHVYTDTHPERFDGEDIKERAGMVRDDFINAVKQPNQNTARFIGIALVLAGGFFILQQMNFPWLRWLNGGVLWAGLILLAGIALLIRASRKE
jgi:phage shock protein PspC (stress-responsive transcriptional regulator)